MQFAAKRPPTGIVYDADLGSNIDSVLALALLHGFDGKNEAKLAALSVNTPELQAAQLGDVIEAFYASATTGIAATFFQGLPVGLATAGKPPAEGPILQAVLSKMDAAGKPVYTPRVRKLNDTAIPDVLIRNALTAQYDQNAVGVLAGPATNLVKLLDLPGSNEWIVGKVKFLVVVGGCFATPAPAAGLPDSDFLTDVPAAKRLLAEWPTEIAFSGREIGAALPFPAASIEKDFAYSPIHPVAAAYRACHAMPYDAPTSDMAAVLYAAHPKDGYFQLSEPGEVRIGADGRAAFQRSGSGKHRYLIVDPAQKDRILKIYTSYASAKPVPRALRRPVVAEKANEDAAAAKDGAVKKNP